MDTYLILFIAIVVILCILYYHRHNILNAVANVIPGDMINRISNGTYGKKSKKKTIKKQPKNVLMSEISDMDLSDEMSNESESMSLYKKSKDTDLFSEDLFSENGLMSLGSQSDNKSFESSFDGQSDRSDFDDQGNDNDSSMSMME